MSDGSKNAGMPGWHQGRWRRRLTPAPLTWAMWAMVLFNAIVLWFAFHGTFERDVGNDAAGAGMARAFRELFAMGQGGIVGILALLFLVIRHQGVRVVVLLLLMVASMVSTLLM